MKYGRFTVSYQCCLFLSVEIRDGNQFCEKPVSLHVCREITVCQIITYADFL